MSTYANFTCSIASFSPRSHCCQCGSPYDIMPRITLDTFSPDFPRRAVVLRVREIRSKHTEVRSQTIGNPFGNSRGGHSCDQVRSGTRKSEATLDSFEPLYASLLGSFALKQGTKCVGHNVKKAQGRQLCLTHLELMWIYNQFQSANK